MDNLNRCFFCLKPLQGCYLTPEKSENVCQFFKMVQRHVGGSFLLKQMDTIKQIKTLLNDGDILPCSECLCVLETFNELYDQLKILELRTNMALAQVGEIMGAASEESVKSKRCHDDQRYGQINWVRQELQFKCNNQLTKQFPLVAVKRCKLDGIIKKEFSDGITPNRSATMLPLDHSITTIMFAVTSLKIVLQLSLVDTAGFWSTAAFQNYREQLNFQTNAVRNILVAMTSLKIVFELAFANAKNASLDQKLCPTKLEEIPIDGISGDLKEPVRISPTAGDAKTDKIPKLSKGVLDCHRCQQKFDNFSSLKYHWLRCDLKEGKLTSLRSTADKLVKFARGNTKIVQKYQTVDHTVSSSIHQSAARRQSKFACTKCSKTFNKKSYLVLHQFTHSDQSTWPHPCPICEKRFVLKWNMQIHVLKTHSNDPISSSIRLQLQSGDNPRNSQRKTRPRQKNNERRVSTPKIYECPECGKHFKNYDAFRYHNKTHLSPENWKHCCSICGKRFISKSGLDSHMRSHTKEKPFPCSKCGKIFAHTNTRANHMLIWHGPVS